MVRAWVSALSLALLTVATSAPAQDLAVTIHADDARMTLRGRDNPLKAYQRGVDALFIGDYADAVEALRIYVRAYPEDSGGHLALGVAFMGTGAYADARVPLERVVANPNPPASAHLQLGLAYLRLGEIERAQAQRTALARMHRLCSSECDDYQTARVGRALDELTRAIELAPN